MGLNRLVFTLSGLLLVLCVVAGLVFGLVVIIRHFKKAGKSGDKTAKMWYGITLLCVVIMIASWVMNMGWLRVFLTWFPLPLIHTCIFLWLNFKAASKASAFRGINKYLILSCVTYLLVYLIFPDGGDIGGMYFFFGLIKNNIAANIMLYATPVVLVADIVVLILEFAELLHCKSDGVKTESINGKNEI